MQGLPSGIHAQIWDWICSYTLAISAQTVKNFQHHPLIYAGIRTVKMRMD